MFQFFKSPFFNFEAVRILGTATYGGSDIAECLEAIGQIKDQDPVSWHDAWQVQADKALAVADEALANGQRELARRAYLRASNYTRASGYMFHDRPQAPDSRALATAERVSTIFRKATALFNHEALPLAIPYVANNTTYELPGYLYLPQRHDKDEKKTPILINTGGADSIQEELYYMHPAAGPGLGYAVVTFEGPGQGIVLRRDRLHMRPDWEAVTGAVIDHIEQLAATRPGLNLDTSRIAVAGASMGGYYALRAASDPRVGACVAIDPFVDMWDFATTRIPGAFIRAWTSGWIGDGLVDAVIGFLCALSFAMAWEVGLAAWFFGVARPTETLREMKRYTLKTDATAVKQNDGPDCSFLDRIQCPVMVSGAAYSIYFDVEAHTMAIYHGLKHLDEEKKELWVSEPPGEGGLQAKMGALALCNQKTFAFLDRHLGADRD